MWRSNGGNLEISTEAQLFQIDIVMPIPESADKEKKQQAED